MVHDNPKQYLHYELACKRVTDDSQENVKIEELYQSPLNYRFRNNDFEAQVITLLERYKALVAEVSGILDPMMSVRMKLGQFQNEFLSNASASKYYEYRRKNDNEYFKQVKRLLEENYCLLTQRKQEHPQEVKACLRALAEGIDVCAPGLLGHLEELKLRLSSRQSVWFWLAELRTRLVETYADIHTRRHGIYAGLHVHIWMAFIKYANEMGFELVKSTQEDVFENLANIKYSDKLKLRQYLKEEYNPDSVVTCVEHNFRNMICQFIAKYSQEEEPEPQGMFSWFMSFISRQEDARPSYKLDQWVSFEQEVYGQLQKDGEEMIKSLSPCNQETNMYDLFEFSDDFTQVRVKPEIADNLRQFVKDKLVEQNILTSKAEDDLFANHRKRPQTPLRRFGQQLINLSYLKSLLKYGALVGAVMGGYGLSALITGVPLNLAATLSTSFLLVGYYAVIEFARYELKRRGYEYYANQDVDLSEACKLAFEDGLKAQVSYQAQATALFQWHNYSQYQAYYAGMQAQAQNNQEIIRRFRQG